MPACPPLSPFAPLALGLVPDGPGRVALEAILADPLAPLSEALEGWDGKDLPLDVGFALFAKSPAAFVLAHGAPALPQWQDLSANAPEAIQRIERAVLAHRTWQVGQVLGAALSGAAADALEDWDADGALRETWGNDRVAFLRHRARTGDGAPASWDSPSGPALPGDIHCFIAPPKPETDTTPARLGLVVLGVSVVQYHFAPHAHRLAAAVDHVRAITSEMMWAGAPNPHHGYRVLPFLCHAGAFPVPPIPGSAWEQFLPTPAFPPPLQPAADTPATLLAQAPFWSLFAHPQTTPANLDPLRGLNPHILGCDTLALYEHFALEIAAGPAPRDLPVWVLSRATALAASLATQDLSTPVPDPVARFVHDTLQVIARLGAHHLKAFPVARRQSLSDTEREAMVAFADQLQAMATALAPGPWASQASALRASASHAATMAGAAPITQAQPAA